MTWRTQCAQPCLSTLTCLSCTAPTVLYTCHKSKGQCYSSHTYLLTYAHRSWWSIGNNWPLPPPPTPPSSPAIALCSGLLWSFHTSWSLAVSALLQCLTSNCWEARMRCWMLASWGFVRSGPTSNAVSAWPLVPVPLTPTDLHSDLLLPLDLQLTHTYGEI